MNTARETFAGKTALEEGRFRRDGGEDTTERPRKGAIARLSRVPSRLGSHNGDRRASERSFMQPPYGRACVERVRVRLYGRRRRHLQSHGTG